MSITLEARPRRHIEGQAEPMGDGSVTVRVGSGELVELNATAAALWALCDGQTSVAEMVIAATTMFHASNDTIERDVLRTLDELEHQELISAG